MISYNRLWNLVNSSLSLVSCFKPGKSWSMRMVHFYRNMSEIRLRYSYVFNSVHLVGTINRIHWTCCMSGKRRDSNNICINVIRLMNRPVKKTVWITLFWFTASLQTARYRISDRYELLNTCSHEGRQTVVMTQRKFCFDSFRLAFLRLKDWLRVEIGWLEFSSQ